MVSRNLALFLLLTAPLAAVGQPRMTEEKQKSVCEQAAAWANDGSVQQRLAKLVAPSQADRERLIRLERILRAEGWYISDGPAVLPFDLDRDGAPETIVQLMGVGTCGSQTFASLAAIERDGAAALGREQWLAGTRWEEMLAAVRWGTGDQLLLIDGEPYVATVRFETGKGPPIRLLSWLGEPQSLPLCTFARLPETKLDLLPSTDSSAEAACKSVVAGSVAVSAWEAWAPEPAELPPREAQIWLRTVYGDVWPPAQSWGVEKRMTIDLDGDGKPDNLALWRVDTTSGCGGEWQQVVPMSEDWSQPGSMALATALKQISGPLDAVPTQRNIEIFKQDGRAYVLATRGYRFGEGERLGVYSIRDRGLPKEGAELVQHCSIRQRPQVRVDKYFPLKEP